MPANIFQNFLAGTQARQQEQQDAARNAMLQRQQQMQEQQFQMQQQEEAKRQQFNQLASQFLGPQTMEMTGGLQPGQLQPQAPQRPDISQLAAIDPQRAMQLQAFQMQQQEEAKRQQVEKVGRIYNLANRITTAGEGAPTMARYLLSADAIGDLDTKGMRTQLEQKYAAKLEDIPDEALLSEIQKIGERAAIEVGIAPAAATGDEFTLSEGQVRFDKQGRPIASVAPKPSDKDPTDKTFTRANVLRDEFTALAKDYGTVKSSYDTIKTVAKTPSAAGDLSLVFAYMKLLDPQSSVRESEQASASNAAGVPQRIRAQWNKVLTGETLSTEQRADFVNQAKNIFQTRDMQYKKTRDKYSNLAKRAEVDPIDVVGDEEILTEEPQASNSQPRSFASEAEADAAGIKPGTRVVINGVSGTWQ